MIIGISLLLFTLTTTLFADADKLGLPDLYLEANQKKEGVEVLEGGYLQYKILRKGEGQQVQSYNSPLVRLKEESGRLSLPNEKEEILALDEAISGLKLGILGMREGEIRKLYIHPNLGFGEENPIDPQDSLLIFEVEVIDADASSDAHAASNPDSLPIFLNLDDLHPVTR